MTALAVLAALLGALVGVGALLAPVLFNCWDTSMDDPP